MPTSPDLAIFVLTDNNNDNRQNRLHYLLRMHARGVTISEQLMANRTNFNSEAFHKITSETITAKI